MPTIAMAWDYDIVSHEEKKNKKKHALLQILESITLILNFGHLL
jgi:hypothetical protein